MMPDAREAGGAEAASGDPALVAVCPACGRTSWPPSPHCPRCLIGTTRRSLPKNGRILEYSRVGEEYFCMAEFGNGIRIMCALRGVRAEPAVGQDILLDRVERKGSGYSFVAHAAEPPNRVPAGKPPAAPRSQTSAGRDMDPAPQECNGLYGGASGPPAVAP